MRIELSRYIEGDLDAIADFIAQDNPQRAVTFIQDIRERFHEVQCEPLIYRLRPDIGEDARMATIGDYAVLFHITGNVVRIERVVYGGHNLPDVFDLS
ncbi:MAG TPA: type II toxin-antitoxin system RelE/ParE family toxin [Herbaspirillum sp.]|nr:type II toxin-antitoxin system RelE/ParE family toxin [Herbaspirillum sp.]